MFCTRCGTALLEDGRFCTRCGAENPFPAAVAAVPPDPVSGTMASPPATSGKAIASLILGVFGFIFPAAILAIVLGHLSRSEIRRSSGRLQGDGLAIAGLCMGYLGLSVVPILIIAAIAIPNLLRARIQANEVAAVASVRSINMAEMRYGNAHPDRGYTCNLSDLAAHDETRGAGDAIDEELAAGRRHGYIFDLRNCQAEGPGKTPRKYQLVAYPSTRGRTGTRAFCSDESLVIRFDPDGWPDGCIETGTPLP